MRTNGPAVYGIRGVGQVYNDVYKFVNKCDTVCVYEDFPWDYISFNRSDEETEFVQKYNKYLSCSEEPWES
jgi:hypothetical protein